MSAIHYDLIDKGKRGRLLGFLNFPMSPLVGYEVNDSFNLKLCLAKDGTLTLYPDFTWDFGSYAIDTPAMVQASAYHDAVCILTNMRVLPWHCRAVADRYFRELLGMNGVPFFRRWWCWIGVRCYSEFVARWRDKV